MSKTEVLTALDRCDRCGAAAAIAFSIKGAETPILLCNHHGRQHNKAICDVSRYAWDAQGNIIFDKEVAAAVSL